VAQGSLNTVREESWSITNRFLCFPENRNILVTFTSLLFLFWTSGVRLQRLGHLSKRNRNTWCSRRNLFEPRYPRKCPSDKQWTVILNRTTNTIPCH